MDLAREAGLSPEIWRLIWRFAYAAQDKRVVMVQTAKHAHQDCGHCWCPRYSPSPRPAIVNVCHSARTVARDLAQRAGHLIFSAPAQAPNIYFNPEIDTLLVHNEKEYWIRDWGPEGILTQFQKLHAPEQLRSLAIELDPLHRATTPYMSSLDLVHFTALEEMIFVVGQASDEVYTLMRQLERSLQWCKRDGLGPPGSHKVVSPHLKGYQLAVRRKGALEALPPRPNKA